jgi:CHASE3 domain sensor protein
VSATIADLHAMTDEQVIAAHDAAATNTFVGTDYWMHEIERRSRERATAAGERYARLSFRLSVITVIASTLALVVAIVALFVH